MPTAIFRSERSLLPESYRHDRRAPCDGVYLNELYYRDLCLTLTDGMITAYDCANFEKEEDNRTYIEENLLYHHRTLPIGEFAIGTNTMAYVMAEQYGIAGNCRS